MNTSAKIVCIAGGLLTSLYGLSITGQAQQARSKPEYVETISAKVTPERVMAGGKAVLEVTVKVKEGFHINANKPGDENMIPTEWKSATGKPFLQYGTPIYPAAQTISVTYSPKPLRVYEGTTIIRIPVTVVKKNATPGKVMLGGSLRVQGCNDTSCFAPTTLPVSAALIVNGVK